MKAHFLVVFLLLPNGALRIVKHLSDRTAAQENNTWWVPEPHWTRQKNVSPLSLSLPNPPFPCTANSSSVSIPPTRQLQCMERKKKKKCPGTSCQAASEMGDAGSRAPHPVGKNQALYPHHWVRLATSPFSFSSKCPWAIVCLSKTTNSVPQQDLLSTSEDGHDALPYFLCES